MTSSSADRPQPATIEIPSGADEARRTIPCVVHRADSRRLVLETEEPLSSSTALSVEYNDAMFLGEVIICTFNGEKSWEVEVQIEQILTGLQSLVALRAGLLGEAAPQPFVQPAATSRR